MVGRALTSSASTPGSRRPIKDLVAPGRFLLIAGEDGESWCEAARRLAGAGEVPLDALRIVHLDGDLFDSRCAWLRHRQILARPVAAPVAAVA